MAGSSGRGEDLGGGYSLTTRMSWSKYKCFGTRLVQRHNVPWGGRGRRLKKEVLLPSHSSRRVLCIVLRRLVPLGCWGGVCPGSPLSGGSWCRAFILNLLALTAPHVPVPSASPAPSAPLSHPCGLAGAPVRSRPPAAARSSAAQDLVVWAPWTAALSSSSEGWRGPLP